MARVRHHRRPRDRESIDVLLVEDTPGDVRLLEEAFDATDRETTLHTVTTVDGALDVLARRAASGSASLPDLAFVDLNLPGADGCDALEAIRDDRRLRQLPVIVLTSSDDPEDVRRCYGARANAYVTKPTTHEGFLALANAIDRFWLERVQLPSIG